MKGYRRILVEGAGLLCIGGLLFAFPEESLEAAREGITLCLDVLIPSLFPFFVLSSLLIETGVAGLCARPLSRWMYPLFGVGGAGAAALVLGLIGGYPAGARTIAQLVERGECSREEARRLSRFCNNCGPAFFLGAVGMGVFGSKEVGFLLLGAIWGRRFCWEFSLPGGKPIVRRNHLPWPLRLCRCLPSLPNFQDVCTVHFLPPWVSAPM